MLTPLIHRARKHLEDESLIQVDPHGYLTLKDSVKEGIRVERNEVSEHLESKSSGTVLKVRILMTVEERFRRR